MLPPELIPGNQWRIHSDARVGDVVAKVKLRDGQSDVVLSIQKSSANNQPPGLAGIPNPFGEDGSAYFRVVVKPQGDVHPVILAKSLRDFEVIFRQNWD